MALSHINMGLSFAEKLWSIDQKKTELWPFLFSHENLASPLIYLLGKFQIGQTGPIWGQPTQKSFDGQTTFLGLSGHRSQELRPPPPSYRISWIRALWKRVNTLYVWIKFKYPRFCSAILCKL